MQDFRFLNTTEIVFGTRAQYAVGELTKKHGGKVLLHYGGGHIKRAGLYRQVTDSLNNQGVDFVELGGVLPNPRLSLVKEGIEICRRDGIDFILAVGGGSVIDSAKAIAAGVPYDGDVWDFYISDMQPKEALGVGVVLTIPAAGSEASNSSVITDEANNNKRFLDNDLLRPRFSLLNPQLTFSLPPYQTACGATDIMAHIMERYFTRVKDAEITDRLCEAALKTVIGNVYKVLKKPDDYAARAEIMWTGTLAHNGLLGTGRIEDWSSHMIEHEISGLNDVAHGAGLAVVFSAWMSYVYKHDIPLFAQFASRVWNVEIDYNNLSYTALEGINRTKSFFKSIGLPTSLGEIGISPKHYGHIAANCRRADGKTVGNFVKLQSDDIIEILKLAE